MTRLSFAVSPDLGVELPIEVRRANMALVDRTVSSRTVDLEHGTYFVTAKLPAGEQVTEQVTIPPQGSVTVEIDAGSLVTGSLARTRTFELMRGGSPRGAPEPHEIKLWAGNMLSGSPQLAAQAQGRVGEPVAIGGGSAPLCATISYRGRPRWFALPAWEESSCTLSLIVDPETAAPDLRIALEHPQANLLLKLRADQQLVDEQTATRSASLTAERLLAEKKRDPIAAVVSAYALLRFNDLDRLHDWTSNLFNLFRGLPDAAVILGEHLGRNGNHEAALPALLHLEKRGLPIFSEGIVLAQERLTLYGRYGGATFSDGDKDHASRLARKLAAFAGRADLRRQLTTLSGLPGEPDERQRFAEPVLQNTR